MLSRRGLFGLLAGGAVAAATLDPELALWIPKKKVYSIPLPSISRYREIREVRHIRYWDAIESKFVSRLDILTGFGDTGKINYRNIIALMPHQTHEQFPLIWYPELARG